MTELAQFSDPNQAREAYYGDGENDGNGDEEWTDWQRLEQVGVWWIYGREAIPRTNVQFHVTGELEDGTQVFLDHSGQVVDSMVIFENMDEVNQALENFAQRREDGDVDENRMPTGADPGPGQGGGSGGLLGSKTMLIIVAIVLLVGYYYYRQNGGSLELPSIGGDITQ